MASVPPDTLAPISSGNIVVKVFGCNFWRDSNPRDVVISTVGPWARMHGFAIETCDEMSASDLILFGPFAKRRNRVRGSRMPNLPAGDYERVYMTGERSTPLMNHCEWALAFDFEVAVSNRRYLRYPLYAWGSEGKSPLHQLAAMDIARGGGHRPHFCAFIYGNRRAWLRRFLFLALSQYRRVDAPGRVHNNCPPIGPSGTDKREFLRQRRFTIAFENSSAPGYTTEKIIDSLLAGSVPIYWGDPRIAEQFDERCYINWHAHEDPICKTLSLGNKRLAASKLMRKLATPLTLISVVMRAIKADRDPAIYKSFFEHSPLTEHTRSYLDERRIAGFWKEVLQRAEGRARAKAEALANRPSPGHTHGGKIAL